METSRLNDNECKAMAIPLNSEEVIRKLYKITYAHQQGFEHQIVQLLALGLERFGLHVGILSKIDQTDYIVEYCVVPENVPMQPGDRFDFSDTYCSITCAANEPVALEHIAKDAKLAVHPAYKKFKLESYIGVPIHLDGELYGTLNFSSPNPLNRIFHSDDIDALQLMASWIQVELIRKKQEERLNALNKALEHQVEHDSLTNTLNRRGMYKSLQKSLNHLNRRDGEGVLAMIDIDYFKRVNDTRGHQAGDQVIVSIANQITEAIRDYECVARIGGDEFLLWLPDTDQVSSSTIFQRIMKRIATVPANLDSTATDPITVSIGATYFRFGQEVIENKSELMDTLIAQADDALYKAKKQGRNCFIHYQ